MRACHGCGGVHLRLASWCDWSLGRLVGVSIDGEPLLVTVIIKGVVHLDVTQYVLV